jgi:hypothetical protein
MRSQLAASSRNAARRLKARNSNIDGCVTRSFNARFALHCPLKRVQRDFARGLCHDIAHGRFRRASFLSAPLVIQPDAPRQVSSRPFASKTHLGAAGCRGATCTRPECCMGSTRARQMRYLLTNRD